MKRLRHPITSIREPFGKAGLIVACLALVFAMAGGALAAKGALTGKQKKEVEKIAKKYAGKPGATGAAGAAGPAGSPGKEGPAGPAGKNGTNGAAGPPGPEGNIKATLPSGSTETGTFTQEFKAERTSLGPSYEGSGSSTDHYVLGEGDEQPAPTEQAYIPISFPIPLASELNAAHVHYVPPTPNATGTGDLTNGSATVEGLTLTTGIFEKGQEISGEGIPAGTTVTACTPECNEGGETSLELSAEATATEAEVELTGSPVAACPGTAEEPQALKGNLCMYAGFVLDTRSALNPLVFRKPAAIELGAATTGSVFVLDYTPPAYGDGTAVFGTWAVTAE